MTFKNKGNYKKYLNNLIKKAELEVIRIATHFRDYKKIINI